MPVDDDADFDVVEAAPMSTDEVAVLRAAHALHRTVETWTAQLQ